MTALAGIWSFAGADRTADCGRMLQAQQVYAPDPPATWSGDGIALGRRLFKLLPEDRHDRGPAISADGNRIVVADARLDNRDELIDALGIEAGQARLMAEPALILAALERWEDAAVERLVGDFAFACWDARRQRLLLARDFLGQRPLHYHAGPNLFAFASMPKGLHALEEVPREPDVDAVTRFLALMPEDGDSSYFSKVSRIHPAHLCVVTRDGIETRRYWQPPRTELCLRNAGEYQEALRESMDRAVAARLRGAEGRIATHLSGGFDSSTVTATAARLMGNEGRITAFTSVPREGYPGRMPRGRFGDEGPNAAAVARLYPQIEHVLIRTGARSPVASLDRNFFLFDRPFLNLCNGTWMEAINEGARERGMRVVLTGQHGNMSFSYAGMEWLPELLSQGRLLKLARLMRKLPRHGIGCEGAISQTIGPFLPKTIWRAINRARGRNFDVAGYSAIEPGAARRLDKAALAAGLDTSYRPRRDPFGTRLWVLGRVDSGNYNKGQLGGWSVDVRDPTADRRLVELCLSIPPEQFILHGVPRALARAAFVDRLPSEIRLEKRKGLQTVDWHDGLSVARDAIAEEVERFGNLEAAASALDLGMLRRLLADWPAGGWDSRNVMSQYRLALLRGLSAGHFIRKASGSNV